eukprot:1196169-Prorocentrum_minimum.AAC.5
MEEQPNTYAAVSSSERALSLVKCASEGIVMLLSVESTEGRSLRGGALFLRGGALFFADARTSTRPFTGAGKWSARTDIKALAAKG